MSYTITVYEVRLAEVSEATYEVESVACAEHAAALFQSITRDVPTERFMVAYLDGGYRLTGVEIVAKGGLHGCALTPREVFQGALRANASAIIIGHNHPSGDPSPSSDDVNMTRAVVKAGEALGIPVLDHVIVTRRNGWQSILDLGLI